MGARRLGVPEQWLAPLALAAACVTWGSAFYFAKVALAELSPVEVLAWRFGLAAPVLAFVLWRRGVRLTRRDGGLVALTGVLCVPIGYLIHFEGLERTSATHAALLVGVGSPFLALAAAALGLERVTRRDWLGVGLACLGVVIMVGRPESDGSFLGDLLVLISMAIATAWVLLSQDLARRLGAIVATAWILLAGTAAFFPVLLVTGPPPVDLTARTWSALAVLALGCTIGSFILWNWGASRLPAGRAGVFLNLEPVSGALLGVTLLGDTVGPAVLIGGTVVLTAALLVSTGESAASGVNVAEIGSSAEPGLVPVDVRSIDRASTTGAGPPADVEYVDRRVS